MLPSARLLELGTEAFSLGWLQDVQSTLEPLPTLTAEARVAAFVLRRVCSDVANWMDATQPIDTLQYDCIMGALAPFLRDAIGRLARFQPIDWLDLAALIAASERVRRSG